MGISVLTVNIGIEQIMSRIRCVRNNRIKAQNTMNTSLGHITLIQETVPAGLLRLLRMSQIGKTAAWWKD